VPRYDIFISYARANSARVQPLVELLRRNGFRVFFDQVDIHVADKWKERLSRSIASSRVLILCWSREASESEYVRYELFRAEGLKKRVLPWLLDSTDLPKLVEIQGIQEQEPSSVFDRLKPRLGSKLRWRRILQAALVVSLVCASYVTYRWSHRPWILAGIVRSTANEAPLEGVAVEVTTPDGRYYSGGTGGDGRYSVSIPLPKPANVDVLFRKSGYESDHETSVTTAHDYTMYLRPADRSSQ
jgi:TIR domain